MKMGPMEYVFILGLITTSAMAFGGGVMLAEVIISRIQRRVDERRDRWR